MSFRGGGRVTGDGHGIWGVGYPGGRVFGG